MSTDEGPVEWRDNEPEQVTQLLHYLGAILNATPLNNSAVRSDNAGELLVHVTGLGKFRLRVLLLEPLRLLSDD